MIVHILEWAAWIISAGLAAWMIFDTVTTGRKYDEKFLTTSVEGTDELLGQSTTVGDAR
jgi:hypothetical protein